MAFVEKLRKAVFVIVPFTGLSNLKALRYISYRA